MLFAAFAIDHVAKTLTGMAMLESNPVPTTGAVSGRPITPTPPDATATEPSNALEVNLPVHKAVAEVVPPMVTISIKKSSSKNAFVWAVTFKPSAPKAETTIDPKRISNVKVPGVTVTVLIRPRSKPLIFELLCSDPAGNVPIPEPCRMLVGVTVLVSAVLLLLFIAKTRGYAGSILFLYCENHATR